MLRHIVSIALVAFAAQAGAQTVVHVYSARAEQLIKPVFDAYTKETGVQVKFLTDKEAPLIQRLKAEGDKSPADLLLTVDAGNLWQAANEGVLQAVKTPQLEAAIPAHLRDAEGRWYGLSVRARTIVYAPSRVKPADLSTYEALGDAKWKGKLCPRTSQKVYNQSLVATMIAEHGEKRAEEIVKAWVANLAQPPHASDNEVIEAVAAGRCDVGLVNTYYFGKLKADKPELDAALFWADQSGKGTHVNISGAGVTRHAPRKDEAVKLLEWLASEKAQSLFVDANYEFPANPAVKPAASVAAWGPFKQNVINVAKAGELQAAAIKLMDRVGYK